jgi:Na+/phosphate symporter
MSGTKISSLTHKYTLAARTNFFTLLFRNNPYASMFPILPYHFCTYEEELLTEEPESQAKAIHRLFDIFLSYMLFFLSSILPVYVIDSANSQKRRQ